MKLTGYPSFTYSKAGRKHILSSAQRNAQKIIVSVQRMAPADAGAVFVCNNIQLAASLTQTSTGKIQ
jgi:hypothetical protein